MWHVVHTISGLYPTADSRRKPNAAAHPALPRLTQSPTLCETME